MLAFHWTTIEPRLRCYFLFPFFVLFRSAPKQTTAELKTLSPSLLGISFDPISYLAPFLLYLGRSKQTTKIERQAATTKDKEGEEETKNLDDGGIFHQQDVNAGYYHQQNGEYSNIH